MPDCFSRKVRSEVMRAVKSRGNKSTELRFIEILKLRSIIGWRRNYALPGKPDFVFPSNKVAVFVDGCFWHGHGCRNYKPETNAEYWFRKIIKNRDRDKSVSSKLRHLGWKVLRFWECEINKGKSYRKIIRLRELLTIS